MEVEGWDAALEDELGVSLDELKKLINEMVENSELVQKKRAQLSELTQQVEQKEQDEAATEKLINDTKK